MAGDIAYRRWEAPIAEAGPLLQAAAARVFEEYDPAYLPARLPAIVDADLWLAERDGVPVGFKLGYRRGPDLLYSWLGGVAPEARRMGVASALMERQHAGAAAQGYRHIETRTRASNNAMVILNLRHGFHVAGFEVDAKGHAMVLPAQGAGMSHDPALLARAYALALKSFEEGGCPIGSVLARGPEILGEGHNQRVQKGDPIAHGEMDALRNAGRQQSYRDTTLYTSLSPCMMCAGTIVQFGIPRVVIGENVNFGGNEDFLRARGVAVEVVNDEASIALMRRFIAERPELWNEDIGAD